jgi:hypothetical protein
MKRVLSLALAACAAFGQNAPIEQLKEVELSVARGYS